MLTISAVARAAGVGVETVRFYERKGLIERPARPDSGHRRYGEDVPRRLRFIRHAQELGFSLREIGALLELRVDANVSCADVKAKALGKIAEVEEKIASLERMRGTLIAITETCAGEGPTTECPILDALDEAEVSKGAVCR